MRAFKIGTSTRHVGKRAHALPKMGQNPCRSVVQVYFEDRDLKLSYYNDRFDLHRGDLVYVEGKLEGKLGRVIGVNYNFKIKLSEYKRVIAVVDTAVSGRFWFAGSHLVTFDRETLPPSKVLTWFRAPLNKEDEFVCGNDTTFFTLDKLADMDVSVEVFERGHNYFVENKVRYISVDGERGYAIVEGSEAYEVEFEYKNGEIRNLVCSCFCSYHCKHEVAAMLQLKETLEVIAENYADEYERSGYFAAVGKGKFFLFAIHNKQNGSFTL